MITSPECEGEKCNCNLAIEQETPNPKMIVGSTNQMETKVKVKNSGTEPAFDVELVIATEAELPELQNFKKEDERLGGDQSSVGTITDPQIRSNKVGHNIVITGQTYLQPQSRQNTHRWKKLHTQVYTDST